MRLNLKLSKQARIDLSGYAFIAPNLLGMIVFTFFPFLFSFFISFTDWDYTSGFGNWNFNAGANYLEMWKDEWFVAALKNTLVYALSVVPITVFLALVLAVIIDKYCYAKTPLKLAQALVESDAGEVRLVAQHAPGGVGEPFAFAEERAGQGQGAVAVLDGQHPEFAVAVGQHGDVHRRRRVRIVAQRPAGLVPPLVHSCSLART